MGNIQLAVVKPFIERCLRLVEYASKRLLPMEVFVCEPTPKTLVILIRFTAKREISVHPGDGRVLDDFIRGWEDPMLMHQGLDL
jgi:hypothetical protein